MSDTGEIPQEPEYEYVYQDEEGNPIPICYAVTDESQQIIEFQYFDDSQQCYMEDDGCFFDEFGQPYIYETVNETAETIQTEPLSQETNSHLDSIIHNVAHYPASPSPTQSMKRKGPTTKLCEICGAFLKHPSKIAAHMRTHTGERPFICGYCGQGFTQRTPWKTHVKRHIGDTPFSCSYCPKSFVNASTWRAHETRVHLKPGREPPTKIVEAPAPTVEEMVNLPDVLVLTKIVKAKDGLNEEKEITIYVCQICGMNLRHPAKAEQHILTHTGYKFKPYECLICGLFLSSSSTFKLHYNRFHSSDRPFACRWNCGRRFPAQSNRNEHEKVVHTKIKRYQCAIEGCQKLFTRRLYLCKHLNNAHPGLELLPEAEKGHRVVAIPYDTEESFPEHFNSKSAKLVIDSEGTTYLVDIIGPMGQPFQRDPNYIENEFLDYFEGNNENESEAPPLLEREDEMIPDESEIILEEAVEENCY